MADEPRVSWTQACCDDCWDAEHPDRLSPRSGQGAEETCCYCGEKTCSGIYVRVDPSTVPYASRATD